MTPGFIGLGQMGGAIARRLLQSRPVVVFDKRPDALRSVAKAGGRAAHSARALAEECEIVLTCLPDSRRMEEILFGEGGIADAMQPGGMLVDMTSGDPVISRSIAARLSERRVDFADAPVSGGPMGAERGILSIMVGTSDAAFERIAPLLRVISPNVTRIGEIGAGHTMKLANNLLNAVCRLATAEAVALAVRNGVEPALCVEMLQKGSGRNYATEVTFPRDVLSGEFRQGFTVGLMHKDVSTAARLARECGVPIVFGEIAEAVYRAARQRYGPDTDVNCTVRDVETESGIRIRPPGRA